MPVDWVNVAGVVLGAPIYAGRHQQAAVDFATSEAGHLSVRPSAFFSVSLSAGSRNPAEVDAAHALAKGFVSAVGWQPLRLACFAGKLAYTRYGFVKRQIMRFIAWREGAPTDARRDYEFTDWTAVRRFALDVAEDVSVPGGEQSTGRVIRRPSTGPVLRLVRGKFPPSARFSPPEIPHFSSFWPDSPGTEPAFRTAEAIADV